jgi:hypothetical protein
MKKQEALELLINTVYESLFGMNRAEMLARAENHPHRGLGAGLAYEFGDEDEAMRDCLSEDALKALGTVEGNLAKKLDMFTLVSAPNVSAAVKSLERVVKAECEAYVKQHGRVEMIFSEA